MASGHNCSEGAGCVVRRRIWVLMIQTLQRSWATWPHNTSPKTSKRAAFRQAVGIPEYAVTVNEDASTVQQGGLDEFDDPYDDDVWKDIANGSVDPQIVDSVGSTSQVCGTSLMCGWTYTDSLYVEISR